MYTKVANCDEKKDEQAESNMPLIFFKVEGITKLLFSTYVFKRVNPASTGQEYMGESSKFPKSWTLEIQIFKLTGCLHKLIISYLSG